MNILFKSFFVCYLLFLCSCAAMKQVSSTVKPVAIYSTRKIIENADTAQDKRAKAMAILSIVDKAKLLISLKSNSISSIEKPLRDIVPWSELDNADAFLADVLITTVVSDINSKIDEGVIDHELNIRINTLLGYIETAARSAI